MTPRTGRPDPRGTNPSHGEYPDQVSRDGGRRGVDALFGGYRPAHQARRGIGLCILAVLLVIVSVVRILHAHARGAGG